MILTCIDNNYIPKGNVIYDECPLYSLSDWDKFYHGHMTPWLPPVTKILYPPTRWAHHSDNSITNQGNTFNNATVCATPTTLQQFLLGHTIHTCVIISSILLQLEACQLLISIKIGKFHETSYWRRYCKIRKTNSPPIHKYMKLLWTLNPQLILENIRWKLSSYSWNKSPLLVPTNATGSIWYDWSFY